MKPTLVTTPVVEEQERLYPQAKRKYQNLQLMNLLLRPLVGAPVRLLAALRISGDFLSGFGICAYVLGASLFVFGGEAQLAFGTLAFCAGLLAELLDGGLARLRGPSAIGHGLSKWLEQLFLMLLTPSLALGLYASGSISLGLAAAGILAGLAQVAVRAAIEAITSAHPAERLAALADQSKDPRQLFALAQFLPQHAHFRWWMRASRVLRENLMESSGLVPLALLVAIFSGHPSWFLWYQALIQIPAYLVFSLLRLLLLRSGAGRILPAEDQTS